MTWQAVRNSAFLTAECATASSIKDKVVAVVGGGDTALGDALYLSKLAKTVYLIHRRDEFRANKALQKKVAETDNIVPVMSAVIKEVTGGENAEGIVYIQNDEEKNIAVDGVFCAIGSVPNTQALEGVCELDESGYVKAGEDGITTAKGLFVAGDVRYYTSQTGNNSSGGRCKRTFFCGKIYNGAVKSKTKRCRSVKLCTAFSIL